MAQRVERPRGTSRWRLIRWFLNPDSQIGLPGWVVAATIVALFTVGTREVVLLLLAVGLLLVPVVLRIWEDHALDALGYSRAFSTTRALIGDTIHLDLIADNAKPLPIGRLRVRDRVDADLAIRNVEITHEEWNRGYPVLEATFTLGMYERSRHRYEVTCHRRGWLRVGPAELTAEDPFGLISRPFRVDTRDACLVYPRMVPLTGFPVPSREPIGDASAELTEDATRIVGVREYVPGDAPRRVHWRATARLGTLQSRVLEKTATANTAVFLDNNLYSPHAAGEEARVRELSIVVAASLCRRLLDAGQPVGLYVNSPVDEARNPVRLPPGRRRTQLTRILEALAMVSSAHGERVEHLLARQMPLLPWGTTAAIITARPTAEFQRTLNRLARSTGRRFVLVVIGDAPILPGLTRRVTVVGLDGEEAWDDIAAIALQPR
ncbi:MAG TPA: DUF58 domain-containing protein [Propionibacteriaceae bacterium]|nr:DUF58 domain-containing protein [Propionibacteriaceae bacterium]